VSNIPQKRKRSKKTKPKGLLDSLPRRKIEPDPKPLRERYSTHELAELLIPPLRPEDRHALKMLIKERGQLDDIIRCDGKLLYGAVEFELCQELEITPHVTNLPSDVTPLRFMIDKLSAKASKFRTRPSWR
jgi:hypothetical protein